MAGEHRLKAPQIISSSLETVPWNFCSHRAKESHKSRHFLSTLVVTPPPPSFPELTVLWLRGFDYHRVTNGASAPPQAVHALWGVLDPAAAQVKRSVMSNRGVREPWDPMEESTDPRMCWKWDLHASGYSVKELDFMRCQISPFSILRIPEPSAGAHVVKFIFVVMLKHRLLFFFPLA